MTMVQIRRGHLAMSGGFRGVVPPEWSRGGDQVMTMVQIRRGHLGMSGGFRGVVPPECHEVEIEL